MYEALLQFLQTSSIVHNPQIVELKTYGRNAFQLKIRALVTSTLTFQVWLNHNPRHIRYAYQLFSRDNALLRWDNAPHYPHLKTNFPHHFHDSQGQIVSSPLQGDPLQDVSVVLAEIEHYISTLPTPE